MGLGIMCWGHALVERGGTASVQGNIRVEKQGHAPPRDVLTTGLFSNMGSSRRLAFLSSANTTLLLMVSQSLNRHLI